MQSVGRKKCSHWSLVGRHASNVENHCIKTHIVIIDYVIASIISFKIANKQQNVMQDLLLTTDLAKIGLTQSKLAIRVVSNIADR